MDMQNSLTIHFVCIHTAFIKAVQAYFKDEPNIKYTVGNIATIQLDNTVFIAPTDSFGNMNHGISRIYNERMFPNIETNLKTIIIEDHTKSKLSNIGRYLPIGEAVIITTPKMKKTNSAIICTPTVFLPSDVSHTTNAYDAFKAVLEVLLKMSFSSQNTWTLICPALCTSAKSNMTYEESARQIYQAYVDSLRSCTS